MHPFKLKAIAAARFRAKDGGARCSTSGYGDHSSGVARHLALFARGWRSAAHRSNLCRMRRTTLSAVLIATALATLASQPIPQDTGATGAWQKIQKLKTTASVLHGTAHPDDEQGGVLAKLSRGDGARVMLLTLTRGESGDNAIGPQLFDALGAHSHRRTADGGQVLRRRRAVLLDDDRLRLFEAAGRNDREVGTRERLPRRRPSDPHDAAVDRHLTFSRQRARRPRQSLGRGPAVAAGDRGRGRSDQIPRADRRRPAAMVTVEGVHGRRARRRELDGADRQRRVQPGARRFLREHREPWPELSAVAERRAIRSDRGPELLVLHAHGVARDGAGQRDLDLRRHRHDLRRPVQDARSHGTGRCRLGTRSDRRRGCPRDLHVQVHRSGVGRAGAGRRPEADARGHGEIRERAGGPARTCDERTPVPGCDQRRARRGVVGVRRSESRSRLLPTVRDEAVAAATSPRCRRRFPARPSASTCVSRIAGTDADPARERPR